MAHGSSFKRHFVALGLFALGLFALAACSAKGIGGLGGGCPESKGNGSCYSTSSNATEMNSCNYNSGNAESCTGDQMSGHCPSGPNLIGCCVTTGSADGCTETGAACFYGTSMADMQAAQNAMSLCTGNGNANQGMLAWSTSPP